MSKAITLCNIKYIFKLQATLALITVLSSSENLVTILCFRGTAPFRNERNFQLFSLLPSLVRSSKSDTTEAICSPICREKGNHKDMQAVIIVTFTK